MALSTLLIGESFSDITIHLDLTSIRIKNPLKLEGIQIKPTDKRTYKEHQRITKLLRYSVINMDI